MLINGYAIFVFAVSRWLLPTGCVLLCLKHSIGGSIIYMYKIIHIWIWTQKFNSFSCIYWAQLNCAATTRYFCRASHISCVWFGLGCRCFGKIYTEVLSVEQTVSRKWHMDSCLFQCSLVEHSNGNESSCNRLSKRSSFPINEILSFSNGHQLLP